MQLEQIYFKQIGIESEVIGYKRGVRLNKRGYIINFIKTGGDL